MKFIDNINVYKPHESDTSNDFIYNYHPFQY